MTLQRKRFVWNHPSLSSSSVSLHLLMHQNEMQIKRAGCNWDEILCFSSYFIVFSFPPSQVGVLLQCYLQNSSGPRSERGQSAGHLCWLLRVTCSNLHFVSVHICPLSTPRLSRWSRLPCGHCKCPSTCESISVLYVSLYVASSQWNAQTRFGS